MSSRPSRLTYHGTELEVMLGDRIALEGAFGFRSRRGTVACIPQLTALELQAQGKAPEDWLLKMDDGTFTGWLYSPEDFQPIKRLKFLGRGDGDFTAITNGQVDELEAAEEKKTTWMEQFLLGAVVVALFFGGMTVIVYAVRALKNIWRSLV